jgi:hypothetical protein
MGHKKMLGEPMSPEEFAEEALGSAREQTMRWYEGQIAWRVRIMQQYKDELDILRQQYDTVRRQVESPPQDTGPNPVPTPPAPGIGMPVEAPTMPDELDED